MATKFFTQILSIYYPKELREDDPSLQKSSEDKLKEKREKTHQALEALVSSKVSAAIPVQHAEKQSLAQYIRYRSL
ncbi:unnamed protein product [Rotaria sordida]|uniref:Uncharacterized protein n=1 Tax=Rotaria sordida TaxID=392033 RepID=A0A819NU52_9BILA|nr:unnamed protein product [Rotaria sordida]CAF1371585.1 unnamed protein product [Rotaria sordida]CAF4001984.1 unnamed protein product [Rotaria sordida]CAF4110508.1 unnamed protein product [Rotaria sordida]